MSAPHRERYRPIPGWLVVAVVVLGLLGCGEETGPAPSTLGPAPSIYRRPRLGTRVFVASVLRDVFGVGNDPTGAVQELVLGKTMEMGGGPCDPNGTDCLIKVAGFPRRPLGGETQLATVPGISVERIALVIRACRRSVSVDAAVRHALAKIGASVAREPDSDELAAAFGLFYPGRTPSREVLEALAEVAESGRRYGILEAWRYVLLALCEQPGWQVP